MDDHFCYYPWVNIDINEQRNYRPCCKYNNLIANNLRDYQNSPELAQLKQDFLDGKKPEGCVRCWRDEDAGVESNRQRYWKTTLEETVPDLDKLKSLSMPFGNICNLTCRTCKSYSSSKWLNEDKKLKKHFPEHKVWPHNKYYQTSNFLEEAKSLSKHLVLLEIPGGEPFLTGLDVQLEYLDFLIEHNAHNITLHYTTNVTLFPQPELWERWSKFKKVDIQLSIDGIGSVFEYTRYPGNWDEVYINIKKYQQKQKENDNIHLSISHTVSALNIFYLDKFIQWCRDEELPKPYLGTVHKPAHFNTKILSKETKKYLTNWLTQSDTLPVIAFMNSEDNQNLLEIMLKYVTIVDGYRNQKFSESMPEYYELLKSTCNVLSKLK